MSSHSNSHEDMQQTIDKLSASMDKLNDQSLTFSKAFTTGLTQAIVQGKNLDTVLQNVGKTISNSALKQALSPISQTVGAGLNDAMSSVTTGLTSGITGLFKSIFGFRAGGIFQNGGVQPFADGGVVSSPSYFPMSGGATGLMGEAGPEAIMPLKRGLDGKLGVAGGGQPMTNVTFNVQTPDVQGFAQSQTQITSLLARAVGRGRRGL